MPNILILLGTLLIAIGAIVATYGWNARTEAAQRSGMIKAVAAEWMMNVQVLNDKSISEPDDAQLSKWVLFPRTRTIALEGAIASGLFLDERDREFFTRASHLHELLIGFNQRLSFTEDRMSNHPDQIVTIRKKLRDGVVRGQVTNNLKLFGELLISKYGISRDQRFFLELKDNAT